MTILKSQPKLIYQKGVSLIELLLVVMAVGVLALLVSALPQSIQSIRNSGNVSLATEIANKEMDAIRKQAYSSLSNGTYDFTDVNLYKLPSVSAQYEISNCPENICASGENAKKVKVQVNWVEGNVSKNVELTTLLTEGGITQ